MRNRKNIIIILAIVLILGLLIEVARTEYLFKLGGNNNGYYITGGVKRTDALSKEGIDKIKKERFLILYDSESNASLKIKDNAAHVLNYMKKDYTLCDAKDFQDISYEYKTVIFAFENLIKLQNMDKILNYVSNGGKAFFAIRPADDSIFHNIYQRLGIYEAGSLTDDVGIKLLSNVLIKGKGYQVDDSFSYNNLISVQLRKECRVLALSPKGIPILWDVPCDSGKFMVFNGTMLDMKINRGLIAGGISLLNDDFIYPVMNMKLSFIDDFPAPIPEGYIDNIGSGYGRSLPNFFREVWWSDILKGAKNYDHKYSAMVIENYSDRVKPPFDSKEDSDVNSLIVYGREIIKSGGELGIHGYNHQPLTEEGFIKKDMGYVPWESEADMIASLREVKDYISKVFPRYTLRNYVPPSNILSPLGRQAIPKALKDIKVISSVYLESLDEYVQEYEVSSDGIVELPRMSYGYWDSQVNNWSIMNGVTSIGVFSHFIHPDDVLDMERSDGKAWEEMLKEYNRLSKRVFENYRWLRSMTASQGGAELENYLECEVYTEYTEDAINIYCNNYTGDMYFILRTDKKASAQKNCRVYSIDEDTYLIHGEKADIKISLSR